MHPLLDKLQAVKEAPTPRNVTDLKSYVFGLIEALWQVPSKFFNKALTTVPTVSQRL